MGLKMSINFFHFLGGTSYGCLALYVQWQYIIMPVNLLSMKFIMSVILTLGAGVMIPFFLMIFPKIMANPNMGSSCTKSLIFFLLACTCIMQILFGALLLQGKNYANDVVERNLGDFFESWDGDGSISQQWDNLQQDFTCCGVNGYQDWSNFTKFEDYANHYNATTEYPTPESCCTDMYDKCGLYTNTTSSIYEGGCSDPISVIYIFNLELIGSFVCGISGFEFLTLIWTFLFTEPAATRKAGYKS